MKWITSIYPKAYPLPWKKNNKQTNNPPKQNKTTPNSPKTDAEAFFPATSSLGPSLVDWCTLFFSLTHYQPLNSEASIVTHLWPEMRKRNIKCSFYLTLQVLYCPLVIIQSCNGALRVWWNFFLNLKDLNAGQLDSYKHGATLFNHGAVQSPALSNHGWNEWSHCIDFEPQWTLYDIDSNSLNVPAPSPPSCSEEKARLCNLHLAGSSADPAAWRGWLFFPPSQEELAVGPVYCLLPAHLPLAALDSGRHAEFTYPARF